MYKRHRLSVRLYFRQLTSSYRDVEELLKIRGIEVDHSTLKRWVFKFSPIIEVNMHKRSVVSAIVGEWMRPISRPLAESDGR
jgi:putative transposase